MTLQIEVDNNIADKFLWLLENFKNDIKIKIIDHEINKIIKPIKEGLKEVNEAKNSKVKLEDAWKVLDEL